MKYNDVVYAGFSALAYLNWDGIKPGTFLKDAVFDIKKKNTNKLNTKSEHLFMVYSEDPKNEAPLWDREFDNWKFLYAADGAKLYNKRGVKGVPSAGFYAVAFMNTNKDIIISFRGTNDLSDCIADIQLYLGSMSYQLLFAYNFVSDIVMKYKPETKHIHITGHSLGGALAQSIMNIDSNKSIEHAYTFNAFGIKEILDNDMSDICLANCLGWMGVPNIGSIINDLKKDAGITGIKNTKPGRVSLLGDMFDISSVENSIRRAYHNYSKDGGSFNTVIEKDSNVFKNLKYQIGTVSSKTKAERDIDKFDSQVIANRDEEIPGFNYKCRLIFDMIKYIKMCLECDKNDPHRESVTNYIISKDVVGSCQPHLGETIRIDNLVLEPYPNQCMKSIKGIDKNVFRIHSPGNFFMFLNNNGNFDGKVRKAVILNLLRDYILNNKEVHKIFKDPSIPSVERKAVDLVMNIPVMLSIDQNTLDKYGFGYLYKELLASFILEEKRNEITVGLYGNVKHDGIDFNKDAVKIKIV